MKKLLCIICCLSLLVPLCCCAATDEEILNEQSALKESATELFIKEPEKEEEPTPPKKEEPPVATPEPEPEPETPVDNNEPSVSNPLGLFEYTVNDPDNTRGLSTERHGFSYGVAKNGQPHNQSVTNQNNFDAYQNVEALALDTKTEKKVMYLTFDNGYEYQNLTADILDTLKEKNVKAAFFLTGSYAKNNKELVRRMIDEGHIVGNHSYSHPSFPNLTRTQMAEEIAKLDNYFRTEFSYTSSYFRFPSGEYTECALDLVTSIGFKSIFWSVAYADWDTSAQKGSDNAYETVTSRFHPGAVILLHAVSKDNAEALGSIIDKAISEGYSFATLDEYFK